MSVVQNVSKAIQEYLNDELDELARECGVVIRERVFTGKTLLSMILATLLKKPDATWSDFQLTAAQLGLEVSQAAIQKRFAAGEPLVDFIRSVFERAIQKIVAAEPVGAPLFESFPAVLIGDATTISLPNDLADRFEGCGNNDGTKYAALKLQVQWDLKNGRLVHLSVEQGKASDCKSEIAQAKVAPGCLTVFDLGYFSVERFAKVIESEGKFISRFLHGTDVFEAGSDAKETPLIQQGATVACPDSDAKETPQKETALDLLAFLQKQSSGQVDRPIRLGQKGKILCRLIGIRVPAEVANRRRQHATEKAKKHGREPNGVDLALLDWSLFVTNCSAEELTWKEVVVLYKGRWQIELLFKLWKSHNGLAKHRAGAKGLEVLAVLYGKLLGVLLQHWVLVATGWQVEARSLAKAGLAIRDVIKELVLAAGNKKKVEEILYKLRDVISKYAKVRKRKKNPSHAELIENPELLDWVCAESAECK